MSVKTVPAPSSVWRVGRGPDPLTVRDPLSSSDLDRPRGGNRWDDPLGQYAVLYFGSAPEACYGETIARFRPDLQVVGEIIKEWEQRNFVKIGGVPADWRFRRLLARVSFEGAMPFVDVDAAATLNVLRTELANAIMALGNDDVDVALVTGADRRVTRLISRWVYDQQDEDGGKLYDGIRYRSHLGGEWECWAAFEDAEFELLDQRAIPQSDAALQAVAQSYQLVVF